MKKTYKMPKDFTVNEVAKFKEDVYHAISESQVELTIDFTDCTFIDSTGLGAIVSIFKRLNEQGGQLVLQHMSKNVKELFLMTRLDHVMKIED